MPNPTSKLNLVINGVTTQLDIHDANAVDLTNNQTVGGNKEFTGTTTAHDVIPSATDTYNFGSPSYQWNNAYIKSLTINGVACGDILTHNVSEFVKVTGNQTIGGVKTFSSNVIIQGSKKVTCNLDYSFIELDGGTTWGKGGSIVLSGQDRSSYANSVLIVSKSDTNTDILQYQNGELKPLSNNTNDSSLGTSSNKWKSFNGINPGALSLPSTATGYVDIKSTVGQYLKDNNTNIYEFTAPFDGWICVGIIRGSLRIDNITTDISNGSEDLTYWSSYTIPFRKNDVIQIKINKMDPADDYVNDIMWKAHIYPCQGNV